MRFCSNDKNPILHTMDILIMKSPHAFGLSRLSFGLKGFRFSFISLCVCFSVWEISDYFIFIVLSLFFFAINATCCKCLAFSMSTNNIIKIEFINQNDKQQKNSNNNNNNEHIERPDPRRKELREMADRMR